MEPDAFVAEVYRRMRLRGLARNGITPPTAPTPSRIAQVVSEYRALLPRNRDAIILDNPGYWLWRRLVHGGMQRVGLQERLWR